MQTVENLLVFDKPSSNFTITGLSCSSKFGRLQEWWREEELGTQNDIGAQQVIADQPRDALRLMELQVRSDSPVFALSQNGVSVRCSRGVEARLHHKSGLSNSL